MSTKKAPRGMKKVCASVVKAEGLKADGTLRKGHKYLKGGRIVKVPKKAPTTTKKRK
jgi:hypothetical protein